VDALVLAKLAHGCCLNCGHQPADYNDLDPHHITTRGAGGEDTLENIAPLCHICHRNIHRGFLVPDLCGGATTHPKALHGDEIKKFLRRRVKEGLERNPARRNLA
jgi:hypothetical protein